MSSSDLKQLEEQPDAGGQDEEVQQEGLNVDDASEEPIATAKRRIFTRKTICLLSLALAAIALGLGVGYGVSGRQDKVGSAALSESSPWDVVSEDLPVAVDANVVNETGPPVVEVVPTLRPTVLAEPQVVEEESTEAGAELAGEEATLALFSKSGKSLKGLQNGIWERRRVPNNSAKYQVWTYGGNSKAGKQGQGANGSNKKLDNGEWICIRKKNSVCQDSKPKPKEGEGLEDGHWRFLPREGQQTDSKSGKHNDGSIVWAFEKKKPVKWIWVANGSKSGTDEMSIDGDASSFALMTLMSMSMSMPPSSAETFGRHDFIAPAEVDVGSGVARSSKTGKPTLAPASVALDKFDAELDDGVFGEEGSSEAAAERARKGLQNGHWEIVKSKRVSGIIWALDEEGGNDSKAGKGRKDETPLEKGKWVCLGKNNKCLEPNKYTLEVGEWRKAKVISGKKKITIWVLDGKKEKRIYGWVYSKKKAMDDLTGLDEDYDNDFFELQEGENLIIGSDEVIFEVEGDEEETDLYVGLDYNATHDSTSEGEVV